MSTVPNTTPTVADFEAWCRSVMGISTTVMPTNDPGFALAFAFSQAMVPIQMAQLDAVIYTYTVYNLGGSYILQWQQDQTNQTFFAAARTAYGINNFVAGVISASNDESTGETLAVGEGLQNLDLLSLQAIKNPYGRQAMAWIQALGTNWGIN
jgi:hypothetical protein